MTAGGISEGAKHIHSRIEGFDACFCCFVFVYRGGWFRPVALRVGVRFYPSGGALFLCLAKCVIAGKMQHRKTLGRAVRTGTVWVGKRREGFPPRSIFNLVQARRLVCCALDCNH